MTRLPYPDEALATDDRTTRARVLCQSHIERLNKAIPLLPEFGDGYLARQKVAQLVRLLPTINMLNAGMHLGMLGPNGLGPWVDMVCTDAAAVHYAALADEAERIAA